MLIAGVVVAGLALYYLQRLIGTPSDSAAPRAVAEAPSGEQLEASLAQPSTLDSMGGPLSQRDKPEREPLTSASWYGRLVDSSGQPIAGSTISWTPLPPSPPIHWTSQSHSDWSARDGEALLALSRFTESNEQGQFSIVEPASLDGSVIWATHPEFEAGYQILPASGELADSSPILIQLEPSTTLRARVVDDGKTTAGALVWQLGSSRPTDESAARQALELLVRRYETDESGHVPLHPFPGPEGLRATHHGRASKGVHGDFEGEVLLRLQDTFTASGTVAFSEDLNEDDEYVVHVHARTGHIVQAVDSTVVGHSGSWGPVSLPLVPEEEYVFSFRGGDAIPREESRPTPASGSHVVVDFVGEPGNRIWALVADEDGNILFDSTLFARWTGDPAGEMWSRPFPEDHDEAPGFFLLKGIPDGFVSIAGFCDGYVSDTFPPIEVPEKEAVTSEIRLQRAARITGQVLYRGQPVDAFEVCYWNEETDVTAWRKTFLDREDGSFELLNTPTGEVWVLATGRSLPRSEPALVRVSVDESAHVVLDLQEGVSSRLTLLDQETGSPVPNAEIRRLASVALRNVAFWGPKLYSDSSGQALVSGLVEGGNSILVRAEGYGDTWGNWVVTDGHADPYELTLATAKTLRVRLEGIEGEEMGRYAAGVESSSTPGRPSFGPDGVLEFGPLSEGRYDLVLYKDRSYARSVATETPVSGDWEHVFDLRPTRQLIVTVVPEEGFELPDPLFVNASSVTGGRGDLQVAQEAYNSQAAITGLPLGLVSYWAYGIDQKKLGYGQAVQENGEVHATLRATSSELVVRLVDEDSQPVPLAEIYLRRSGDRLSLPASSITNDLGIVRAPGLDPGEYEIHATLDGRGTMITTVRLRDSTEDPVEITFAPTSFLSVSVLDDLGPIAGVSGRLSCANDSYSLGETNTTDTGYTAWDKISPGVFRLELTHPLHWPVVREFELGQGSSHRDVAMHRLGSLALRFVDAAGAPASGIPVELTSTELEESVTDWVADGLLPASTSLATGMGGWLRVTGIPTGGYRWKVGMETGFAEARLEAASLTITLP